MKDDAQVRQDVLRELQWDGRVDDADIGVEVDGAVATLTGRVSTYASRHAAQAAAHRVFGVLDVVNNLEVQVPGSVARNDTDIAHAVRHALEWDVRVPDERGDRRRSAPYAWRDDGHRSPARRADALKQDSSETGLV